LKRNIEDNKRERAIRLFPHAVADVSGTATFNVAENVSFSSLRDTGRSAIVEQVRVEVVALDVVPELAGQRADLMKIDVERGEGDVLFGARDLLARSPRAIVLFEFSHKNLTADRYERLDKALAALAGQGFRLWRRSASGRGEAMTALPGRDEVYSGNLYLAREEASQRLLVAMQRNAPRRRRSRLGNVQHLSS